VGHVAPERSKRALGDLVEAADWGQAEGRFVRLSHSGKTAYVATRFTSGRDASPGGDGQGDGRGDRQTDEDDEAALREPEAPPSLARQVLSAPFRRGKAFVMSLLTS
jgi:hypothetical protein